MVTPRWVSGWFLIASAAALGGCAPDDVLWTPDSGGLVFSTHDDMRTVYHYDLNRKTLDVVVPPEVAGKTTLPGLSPDGTHVAVARVRGTPEGKRVEIRTVKLDGTPDLPPREFPWARGAPSADLQETAVEWSPDGRHLLVNCLEDPCCGLFDRETGTFRLVEGYHPVFCRMMLGSVIAPDGSGFLVVRVRPDHDKPVGGPDTVTLLKDCRFVDWDGRVRELALSPEQEAVLRRLDAPNGAGGKDPDGPRRTYEKGGYWEGRNALLPTPLGVVVLDTDRLTITFKDDPATVEEWSWADREGIEHLVRLADGVIVATRGEQILYKTRKDDWRPVVPRAPDARLFPSPDGRLVAARYHPRNDLYRVTVIDREGKIVGEIDTK